jgi:hypothetical protein
MKYYRLKKILSYNAKYNFIFGERSNGKTYSVLEHGLINYIKTGKQTAIIRRYQDDFTGKRGQMMCDNLVTNGAVAKLTNGEWTTIYYYGSRWYLARIEEDRIIKDTNPWAFGFALTSEQHDKSTSYPNVTTILFDEVISRTGYLDSEFVLFTSVLSTIIRDRTDVTIFMLGNTINKYCPYFKEMGLKHVKEMDPGDIDVYSYGESGLTVAVEYTKSNAEGKPSDVYFAFDNPKLSMITGGAWELDIYPHCPVKYKPKDIIFIYFILFDSAVLQCEIVSVDDVTFTFIHKKTTPLMDPYHDLIYTPDFSPRHNYRRLITQPQDDLDKKIAWYYKTDRIFYQDNEVGEIVRNYLMFCAGEQ